MQNLLHTKIISPHHHCRGTGSDHIITTHHCVFCIPPPRNWQIERLSRHLSPVPLFSVEYALLDDFLSPLIPVDKPGHPLTGSPESIIPGFDGLIPSS
ncbi:uncharacterized protein BO87DRAFT_155933 [Aspergillus neoniger CBS 115656]|uniref:Uncharacterized protein n=1 Tax=Aspergillus neoniger (strain CBS 115656) TaxID=1448310 RepID=A0A318YCR2_ASPNB|nr:hypothetical protein BO87DRAFT_155933 [Aspergillus neoniger CBS 115656]PYH30460.1 hypothetical protein BO87DRAFT_155933 [Aspergillus neoniger CBS 115656]